MRISTPVLNIVDNVGNMLINFKTWTQLVSDMSILEGNGSPEGVESAKRTRQYHDLDGATGTSMYIKKADSVGGDDKLGWILQ